MQALLAFVGLAALIVVLPGPATTLVMATAMGRGLRPALLTATGLLTADLLWMVASVAGLTALLVASQPAFEAVRLAGAAYLVYLGVRLLLAREDATAPERDDGHAPTGLRSYRQGLLCNLTNPKTLIVFTSVIPQLVPGDPTGVELGLFGALFALIGFGASIAYAFAFSRLRTTAGRPALRRWLRRGSGGVLIAFGARLAIERR